MTELMQTGIVLEGGAMRGIYTAGVLDALLKENITVDGVIGVSAGAIHGLSYVAGQYERSIRYYLRYCGDRRFVSLYSFLTTGDIVNERFCYHDIPDRLDPVDYEAFEASHTKFYVVCSNVESGKAEYILCQNLRGGDMEYVKASASMPFLSRTVSVAGKQLLDGGICDSIPVEAFMQMGYEKLVVVLTRPEGYRKTPSKKFMAKLRYGKYPEFVDAILNRYKRYNDTLDRIQRLEQENKIMVIRPSKDLHIHRLEKDKAKIFSQYELGKRDAESKTEKVKRFLSE